MIDRIRNDLSSQQRPTVHSPPKESKFLEKVDGVVEKLMNRKDFSIKMVCKALELSRAQLYRLFQKHTDITVGRYIKSLRLNRARFLLRNSDLSISKIASEIGFKNVSHFSASYKEEFGHSPSEEIMF